MEGHKALTKEEEKEKGFSNRSMKAKKEDAVKENKKITKGEDSEQKKMKKSPEVQKNENKKSEEEEKEEEKEPTEKEKEAVEKERASAEPPTQNASVAKCSAKAKSEVTKWVKRALDKGVDGLREEFMALRRYVPASMTC
ncbi:unnamed protein product, partial [Toxocara canis]|uniref:Protein MNN4-like n=1 Tax=Toxocara canis TaxID=6265 RepID=A0A183UY86_TOXCA